MLCKRIDGGQIGGIDQIDGEDSDGVRITTLTFRMKVIIKLDQYLRDCSPAVDRVECRKDSNVVRVREIT